VSQPYNKRHFAHTTFRSTEMFYLQSHSFYYY